MGSDRVRAAADRLLGRELRRCREARGLTLRQVAPVIRDFLKRLIQGEGDAEEICVYENLVVPGILQTPAYARHMVRAVLSGADHEEVDRVVELRAERQLRLMNRPLPRVTALLEEGVLHRRCGDAAVMDEQLTHLLRAGETGKVRLRILPMARPYGAAPPYPITHLRVREGEHAELAYVEHINGANYVTRPRARTTTAAPSRTCAARRPPTTRASP
ncbi:DUF5753 domain-containing protein [Streptomyces sp. NPDC020817]|uniref:DUF5753 domain-containing protein n=1 Tax=Streptomyces sp. NPDC020817 TaxID=3365095 RepID=UPI00379ED672